MTRQTKLVPIKYVNAPVMKIKKEDLKRGAKHTITHRHVIQTEMQESSRKVIK